MAPLQVLKLQRVNGGGSQIHLLLTQRVGLPHWLLLLLLLLLLLFLLPLQELLLLPLLLLLQHLAELLLSFGF